MVLEKTSEVLSICKMAEHLKELGKTAEFNGDVYFVRLKDGSKAVFKSVTQDDLLDAYAESVAYKASIFLGFPHVPPTIVCSINGMVGSLQSYIETDVDLLIGDNYKRALNNVNQNEIDGLKLFYFVFGQWDTGPHNLLFKDNHLVAIDNSGIKNKQHVRYGELPFVRVLYSEDLETNDWNKPFPFDSARFLYNPTISKLKEEFGAKLPESFYENFKLYGRPFKYIVHKNGLWVQHHAFDEDFVISYVDKPSQSNIAALSRIDSYSLKEIFGEFSDEFDLDRILERRDQVLSHYRLNCNEEVAME